MELLLIKNPIDMLCLHQFEGTLLENRNNVRIVYFETFMCDNILIDFIIFRLFDN